MLYLVHFWRSVLRQPTWPLYPPLEWLETMGGACRVRALIQFLNGNEETELVPGLTRATQRRLRTELMLLVCILMPRDFQVLRRKRDDVGRASFSHALPRVPIGSALLTSSSVQHTRMQEWRLKWYGLVRAQQFRTLRSLLDGKAQDIARPARARLPNERANAFAGVPEEQTTSAYKALKQWYQDELKGDEGYQLLAQWASEQKQYLEQTLRNDRKNAKRELLIKIALLASLRWPLL